MTPETPRTSRIYEAVQDPKPEAIVVYCSDPRFQNAFEQFLQHELHLTKGRFIPVVIGGGAGVLAHPDQLPKEFKFLKDRFEFYRDAFPTVRRIILLNHEDCHYYDSIRAKILSFLAHRWMGSTQEARADMPSLARIFLRLLGHLGMTIELYFARFADSGRSKIVFEKISP